MLIWWLQGGFSRVFEDHRCILMAAACSLVTAQRLCPEAKMTRRFLGDKNMSFKVVLDDVSFSSWKNDRSFNNSPNKKSFSQKIKK